MKSSRMIPGKNLQTCLTWLNKASQKIIAVAGSKRARYAVLGLFAAQAIVLSFITHIGVPPDETNHIEFIKYYGHHSLNPILTNQQPTYYLGDKTREVDYLYHYTMSLVYRATPFPEHYKYVAIRLVSVAAGLLCLWLLSRIGKRLGMSAATITTGLLILGNLPMVLMVSSAVNNDVFVWLGVLLGVLMLLRLWDKPRLIDLVWLANIALVGGLVKRDLLPVGMIFGVLGGLFFLRHTKLFVGQLKQLNWQLCVALVLCVISFGLFSERVAGNVIRYGSITPTCEKVQSETACYSFWINVRARTLQTLPKPDQLMPAPQFAFEWFGESTFNIIDVQTQFWHHTIRPSHALNGLVLVTLVGGLIAGAVNELRRFKADVLARRRLYVGAIALTYLLVQMAVNYSTYRHSRIYGLALNGRYIIPSILILTLLACYYWATLPKKRMYVPVIAALVVIVAIVCNSGLEVMLRNPQLYTGL